MNQAKRLRHYERSNKGRPLTPRQQQRLKKKNNRELRQANQVDEALQQLEATAPGQ